MQCVTCHGPLVSLLERSRRLCAMCYLLNRSRAEQPPETRPEDRTWYRSEEAPPPDCVEKAR
jgi:hypothetical protein